MKRYLILGFLALVSFLAVFLALVIFYSSNKLKKPISTPQITPAIVSSKIPTSEYSAWIPWWDEENVVLSLENSKKSITTVLPTWFMLKTKGQIEKIKVSNKDQITTMANQSNIKIVPSIGNEFDGKRVKNLLKDEKLMKSQFNNLVNIATSSGYSGYDIDWEEIHQEDRDGFSDFVAKFAQALHASNLTLSVTVHAQTGSSKDWVGTKGQNIEALADITDKVRVMAYDFHNEKSSPGPITPLDSLESVIKYNISIVPLDKLILGLPTYGYDWSSKGVTGISFDGAQRLLDKYQIKQSRDPDSQALFFEYQDKTTKHTVWFEDFVSISAKTALAQKYNIYQFCFWRLGAEDSALWK